MVPFESIIQAALIALFVIVIFLAFVFSLLLAGTAKRKAKNLLEPVKDEDAPDQAQQDDTNDSFEERRSEESDREEEKENQEIPIYEKYPEIHRFEILYWRGVSKPWWWNNYAKDLVDYANEYFPWNRVDYYSTYNSNSKSEDYNYPPFHGRIMSLRPHKRSKHALVVINWSQEFIMVDSSYALEEMKDRIDAEWYRKYGFKKTYRSTPLTYTK